MTMPDSMEYRVVLFHKQATSARTRFVRYAHESICSDESIPMPAQMVDRPAGNTLLHPAAILTHLEDELGLDEGILAAEGEFTQTVEVPGGDIQIILASINSMDPPFEQMEKQGASFIDLTEARGLPQIELEILRSAYEHVLGG